jgi:hypothetical protein
MTSRSTSPDDTLTSPATWLGMWILNSLIASIGVAVTAGILIFSTQSFTTRAIRMFLLSPPYYPLPLVVGLMVGYFTQARSKGSCRYWVWIGPAILVFVSRLSWKADNRAAWPESLLYFFGPRPYPGGPDQIGMPVLLYMSAAYSLGAFTQTKLQRWPRSFQVSHSKSSRS